RVTKLGSKTQIPHYLNLHTFALVLYPVLLQNFLQTRARNARHWLGLTDIDIEGEWKWVDGSSYRNGFRHSKSGTVRSEAEQAEHALLSLADSPRLPVQDTQSTFGALDSLSTGSEGSLITISQMRTVHISGATENGTMFTARLHATISAKNPCQESSKNPHGTEELRA
ncbi:hypothetical protein E2320_016422, partial [Naja naja]